MKLPDGVTIHAGGRVYEGEIPDNMVPKGINKAKITKKLKAQEEAGKSDLPPGAKAD